MQNTSKIVLGTVRFSGVYGVNNNNKILNLSDVREIIKFSRNAKIKVLDTAIDYKKTNKLLGKISLKNFAITSKLPKIQTKTKNIDLHITKIVMRHLKILKIKKLYALYLHHPDEILKKNGKEIILALIKLKKKKLINKIGFSIYSTYQLKKLLNIFKPDIIQFPLSVLDTRFKKGALLKNLYKKKIELHARSIFLQGALLSNYRNLKKKLLFPKQTYKKWQNWVNKKKINRIRGSLSILHNTHPKMKIVIGVETKKQLKEIIQEINKKIIKPPKINLPESTLVKLYNYNIRR